jgi:hypothetical protein
VLFVFFVVNFFFSGLPLHWRIWKCRGRFDPTGSGATYAWTISDEGTIAGFWYDTAKNQTMDSNDASHGFARSADGTVRGCQ